MDLTSDMLRELQACRSDPGPAGDRRTRPRVGASLRAMISALSCDAVRAPVRIRDVSSGGIAFLFPRPLKVGAPFLLHLPATRDRTRRVPCRVTRCERLSSDLFRIGAVSTDSDN